MSIDYADIIGIGGSLMFIAAFMYANATAVMDKVLFNALNLVGAGLLLFSLWVHPNVAAAFLEISWAIIALVSLIKALRDRRRA
jgi:hypothetical protein